MPDKPDVVMIVGGGGGAPSIPPRHVGKPGVRDVAEMCTGKEYDYLRPYERCSRHPGRP